MATAQTTTEPGSSDRDIARIAAPEPDGVAYDPARTGAAARPGPTIDAAPAPPPDTAIFGRALAFSDDHGALEALGSRGLTYLQRQAGNRAVTGWVTKRRGGSTNVAPGAAHEFVAQRVVHPNPVVRQSRLKVVGDGTPANPGMTVREFQAYTAAQADWFTDPALSAADRTNLWKVANLLAEGPHMGAALGKLLVTSLIAASPADMIEVRSYASGAVEPPNNVRITNSSPNFARVKALGKAMRDLATFVPAPVLRICIDQDGLEKLVDEALIPTLRAYYTDFSPTIETPLEQEPLLVLLRGGLAAFAPLKDWVHDLHHFKPAARVRLAANVGDKSRAKPVMLILMSGVDWNHAFLQADNLEAAILNPTNLALVLQGVASLPDETARVNKTADDYGQIPVGAAKGRLGQVVIAGHGRATLVEQTTTGGGATAKADDTYVGYTQTDLQPTAPGDDSEKLIDALLSRMDPADARVVFAGCLVGSHDIDETPDLKTKAKAAKEIAKSITTKPNLRDLVEKRMKKLKVKGKVEASNASTTFEAFNLSPTGKARLSLVWDPDVGGSKAKYVKTGSEPEGALKAALETWADPKLGPKWTTSEMKKNVAAKAGSTEWWGSLTRTAFKIALPAAGDVDPAVLANLAHRVESWLNTGWESTVDVDALVRDLRPAEVPKVLPVMLASDHHNATFPHLPIVVEQVWMDTDHAHRAAFMAAIGATPLDRAHLAPRLSIPLITPHLASLLTAVDPLNPTKAQLFLALTIAVQTGAAMPAPVRKLLVDAAGGKKTTAFPAALHVPDLLGGTSEVEVLRSIGLAAGAAPVIGAPPAPDEANVDLDANKWNETFVSVAPKLVAIGPNPKNIYAKPDKTSALIAFLMPGQLMMVGGIWTGEKTIQVVGTTGAFTAVDLRGTIGFVDGTVP